MNKAGETRIEQEVRREFEDVSELGDPGGEQLARKLRENHGASPVLSGGDLDAAWEDVNVGEESVGGDNPTPDQSVVEDLGKAMGLTYQDDEPLHSESKIHERDVHRWELDPASAEDFGK